MIDKIRGIYGPSPVGKVNGKKYLGQSSAEETDGVEFSAFAKELAKARTELKKVPDVRFEKVEELKKQIQSGQYRPDLHKVAEGLIRAGLLDKDE
ncbi:flagellar biosynthesis anti-sigma factor FlgM [Aminobacterium mobile]|jgi:negative regulator of flagellin synthesis FlgM|uniref:flagellar biosynthesis anti-sigma factor FlgM n=1 Tax=Aminobacterium mobile TaxID=81467 RepID=UPI000465F3BE|nr:flagellar biosynthesis anti-sigma factor FlgM [Aminobacterium mobile]